MGTATLHDDWTPERVRARAAELGPWFHNLNLKGVSTAPDHFLGDYPRVKWQSYADAIPQDLRDRTVLDIGCNGGFFSMEMKRRGADRVVAIDFDEDYLAQARFAAEVEKLDIEFHRMSVYDVAELGERFDIVFFIGVFYHLRHPLLALDLIHEHVARDVLVFQSLQRGSLDVTELAADYDFAETAVFDDPGYPRMHFIEKSYSRDPTNWWVPNRAGTEAMLRSAGFAILQRPEEETYLCRRMDRPDGNYGPVYPARAP
jgi:tRNA (mo5U34)-methyltransferase